MSSFINILTLYVSVGFIPSRSKCVD